MRFQSIGMVALAGHCLIASAGGALAQQAFVRTAKSFGAIEFSVNGGRVVGIYPAQRGRLYGDFIAPGTVQGHWFEPKSNRPCNNFYNGTNSWGSIIITNYGRRNMAGFWGYCNDRPTRPINFQ
jgi:hypothetical protein